MSYIELNAENFEREVMQSSLPVLIDFWAVWCGPCQMIAPVISEIADERDDIKVCKVNVDEQPELAQAFGVSSIPTLVVVKDKKISNVMVGYRTKEEILAEI
ncbi:MAG: thioredoxin [Ruminococcaceae bacterium]|nr:thioredoxin [Oscillospiraceae bacterium]